MQPRALDHHLPPALYNPVCAPLSVIDLIWDCPCTYPKESTLRGSNGTSSQSFCRFHGEPAGLASFADDGSQAQGNEDCLRLSIKYCVDHQPQLLSGASNLADSTVHVTPQNAYGDPLVDRYFYCLILSHDYTVSRQRRAAQPGALDGGLEAIRPQKANIDALGGWTQPVGDSTKTRHRTSGNIESTEIIDLNPNILHWKE